VKTICEVVLAAFLLVLAQASTALGQQTTVSARIVGITDGDTVKALCADNQLLRVRLSWIDAPENAQAFGQRAKQHLSELVFGREVELHIYGLDRYGRTLAVIMLDVVDINLQQVRDGFAWVYGKYITQADDITQANYWNAQQTARTQQRGLWSDPDPIPPWEFRHIEYQGK
jgi:endonuclease YncB( thermonuclease family)